MRFRAILIRFLLALALVDAAAGDAEAGPFRRRRSACPQAAPAAPCGTVVAVPVPAAPAACAAACPAPGRRVFGTRLLVPVPSR